MAQVNLGVLRADMVNIVLHGHNPMLSEVIVTASQDSEIIKAGAVQRRQGGQPGRVMLHRQ